MKSPRDPLEVGLNPYLYCEDDPVNYTDPTGALLGKVLGVVAETILGGAYTGLRSVEEQ